MSKAWAVRWAVSAALATGLAAGGGAVANEAPEAAPGIDGAAAQLTQYVDPLIGTLASNSPNPVPAGQAGSVVPAAGLPSGMVQWAPDTNTTPAPDSSKEPGSPAGYYYDLNTIQSFSLTHMGGAGCGGNDGEFPVAATTDPNQTTSTFSHANEHAAPGYYKVRLDNQVEVELTATLRTGFGRFGFPAGKPAYLVLDATRTNTLTQTTGSITRIDDKTLSGSTVGGHFCGNGTPVKVYFYAKFDHAFQPASTTSGGKAVLKFANGASVLMKIGLSYVSVANAKENLQQENPYQAFDAVVAQADRIWNQRLGTIQVRGGSREALTKFYTAFYHALWAPSVFSDVNGQYLGFDNQVHTVKPGQSAQYTAFSGWDIYRSLIPLKALLYPEETSDMLQSLVNDADQCGGIPHWVNDNVEDGVMPGDAGSLIIAGGYAFGARKFDAAGALAHMIKMANIPGTACNGVTTNGGRASYLAFGYITDGEWGPASSTLEYTSSDFAISRFAGELGNSVAQRILLGRSAYWQNVLDTRSTPPLVTSRKADGSWNPVAPDSTGDYAEGNAEQYTWMVPYDPAGLFAQLGGNGKVVPRLDTFFSSLNAGLSQPYFYMGNEPTFEVPWLYNWAGHPAGTQQTVQRIMDTAFGTGPDGLPGNDDLGAVSGWYVWGALGLYPVIPGVGGLTIGSPQFPEISVRLGNGKRLQIHAPGAPAASYVQGVAIDGRPQPGTWLPVEALARGARMDVALGNAASAWGTQAAAAPPSFGVPVAANLVEAYNNIGSGADGVANADGQGADFDGGQFSYSASALAAAGVQPGQPFAFGGARFTWGGGPGGLDNAVAVGQTIRLRAAAPGGHLVVLGSANNGPSSGQGVLTYTDGSSEPFTLAFDDWTLNGGGATAQAPIAVTTAYRNTADGSSDSVKAYVFGNTIPLAAGKTLASVTLPARVSAGKIHVFGLATTAD